MRVVAWGGHQALLPLVVPAQFVRALTWLARDRRPVIVAGDVLLAPIALALSRLRDAPFAVVAHGLDITYSSPVYRRLTRPALARADRVIAISQHTRGLAIEAGVRPDRCIVITPGVAELLVPARVSARRQIAERIDPSLADRPIVLQIGRQVARKGAAWLADQVAPLIARELTDVAIVILGDGPDHGLVAEAARRHPRTIFAARFADDALRQAAYGAADVYAMPYRREPGDVEGLGLVAIEAAQAGLPVVATRVDALSEVVVDGKTGILVPPESPREFADAVTALLRDPSRRASLGDAARQHARSAFSWDVAAKRFVETLTEMSA